MNQLPLNERRHVSIEKTRDILKLCRLPCERRGMLAFNYSHRKLKMIALKSARRKIRNNGMRKTMDWIVA